MLPSPHAPTPKPSDPATVPAAGARVRRGAAWLGAVALWLGGPAALVGCTQPPTTPQPPARTQSPEVVFHPTSGGSPWHVKVELARTPEELMRGLMFRKSLGADEGMLFLFPRQEPRRFWMRNTYIPLDMVFLDSNHVVVGIEENTVPLDETSRGPDAPAQYVVEVRGGLARQHGLSVGARADFRSVE